jgi:hypothetical protein
VFQESCLVLSVGAHLVFAEFSEVKNKDRTGKITEWFPKNNQTELLKKYDQFTKRDFVGIGSVHR